MSDTPNSTGIVEALLARKNKNRKVRLVPTSETFGRLPSLLDALESIDKTVDTMAPEALVIVTVGSLRVLLDAAKPARPEAFKAIVDLIGHAPNHAFREVPVYELAELRDAILKPSPVAPAVVAVEAVVADDPDPVRKGKAKA